MARWKWDALEWNFYKPSQRKNGRKELLDFTRKFYFLMIPSVFRPMRNLFLKTRIWESFRSWGRKKSLSFNHKSKNRIFRKCWDTFNVSGNAYAFSMMLCRNDIYFVNLWLLHFLQICCIGKFWINNKTAHRIVKVR